MSSVPSFSKMTKDRDDNDHNNASSFLNFSFFKILNTKSTMWIACLYKPMETSIYRVMIYALLKEYLCMNCTYNYCHKLFTKKKSSGSAQEDVRT